MDGKIDGWHARGVTSGDALALALCSNMSLPSSFVSDNGHEQPSN